MVAADHDFMPVGQGGKSPAKIRISAAGTMMRPCEAWVSLKSAIFMGSGGGFVALREERGQG